MVALVETPDTTLRSPSGAGGPTAPVAPEERAARRSLRDQIARLEHDLGACVVTAFPGQAVEVSVARTGGPRVLGIGELEALRESSRCACATRAPRWPGAARPSSATGCCSRRCASIRAGTSSRASSAGISECPAAAPGRSVPASASSGC